MCAYRYMYIRRSSYIGNRVSELDLPLSKTLPTVLTFTPYIYEAKGMHALSCQHGNEKAYWSNDVSTRAVVAKRGKCIVRTTGHYSDAKYEGFFFSIKELFIGMISIPRRCTCGRARASVFLLISSRSHHIYSLVPYNESYNSFSELCIHVQRSMLHLRHNISALKTGK